MLNSRLLATSAATAALALAPAAAFAVGDGPNGAGYNGGGVEAVVVNDSDTSDCSVPITVEAGNAGTVTVEVTLPDGSVVSSVSKPNDINGTVDFVVSLGADCAGSYTISARDEADLVLATAAVFAGESPANAGGDDTVSDSVAAGASDDGVGGLPSTGSSTAVIVGGVAGAGLLAGGSLLLVRRRRAAA